MRRAAHDHHMTIRVNPEDDFHVVKNGHVMALTLDELNSSYQRELIEYDTLIWQEGLTEWMRLDRLLYELEQQDGPTAPSPPLPEDIYFVLVAPGEVKQMSLDLLADAFRLDIIDESTLVWQTGYTEWLPLSMIMGEEPVEHVEVLRSMPPRPLAALDAPRENVYGGLGEDSLAPAAFTPIQAGPSASPWFGRSLVAFVALAFVVVSHRHGAIAAAAISLEQGEAFSRVESNIGAPGIDTPTGLDRWLESLTTRHQLNNLADTEPVPKPEKSKESEAEASADVASKKQSEESKANKRQEAEPRAPTDKPESAASETAAAFGSNLKGEPPKSANQRAKYSGHRRRDTVYKGPKGDRNDPMNGTL